MVLQEISERFRQVIRGGDVIARWGGEEFLILLPNVTHEVAFYRAETIRRLIADKPITLEKVEVQVTISIGVASTNGDKNVNTLLKKADEQLYVAKTQGRNRAC